MLGGKLDFVFSYCRDSKQRFCSERTFHHKHDEEDGSAADENWSASRVRYAEACFSEIRRACQEMQQQPDFALLKQERLKET